MTEAGLPPRESMEVDVVIVGGGPAGLATGIRLMQQARVSGAELNVVLIEKGSEVGAHILSGAVIDPVGLNNLLPDWKAKGAPIETPVTDDRFIYLGPAGSIRVPNILMPPMMSNHGNYIVSLGAVCKWLAEQAEALGLQIFPGFAGTEILLDDRGAVVGIATGDMGVGKDGQPKANFARGLEIRARYTIIAEGARGSLAKQLIKRFELDKNREPQKYGLGLKELWEVAPGQHRPGRVLHTMGWPLPDRMGGGSFQYHFGTNLVSVGFVVHLNYDNPYLSPYEEFQRFKTHPLIRETFEGGKRIAYGARVVTEGGFQSVPELVFPGGALVGCSAGFLNVPRIKGSHNAILTGIMAAEACFAALQAGRAHDRLNAYAEAYAESPTWRELRRVRNVKPLWSRWGTRLGVGLGAADMWLNTLIPNGLGYTLRHGKPDSESLKPASWFKPIAYPKPDGKLTFDRLTNVAFSGTNHEEDQPVHLRVVDMATQKASELETYAGPSNRYCPAGVYEWVEDGGGGKRFQINAQNCVHCKTCDIKDPNQNITWSVPEGGGGPVYPGM